MSSVMAAGTCTGEENALTGAAGIPTVYCLLTLQLTQVLCNASSIDSSRVQRMQTLGTHVVYFV